MAQRSIYFLVVWLLMFNGKIFGQKNPQKFEGKATDSYKITQEAINKIFAKPQFLSSKLGRIYKPEGFNDFSIIIPGSYFNNRFIPAFSFNYANDLGWFCKKELQLDKLTPVRFRFRLGSLSYVNWMEQKPNANKE